MKSDITEKKDAYLLEVDVPGCEKEDVKALLKDGYLTINASHSESKEDKDEKQRFIRKERYSGSYQRSFYVGEQMKEDDIKAKFNNGILTISVPKVEATKKVPESKYIAIEG